MTTESSTQMSRWHWLWIAPLSISAVLIAEAHTIPFGFDVLKLAWHRWTWAGLFSPSAFFLLDSRRSFRVLSLPNYSRGDNVPVRTIQSDSQHTKMVLLHSAGDCHRSTAALCDRCSHLGFISFHRRQRRHSSASPYTVHSVARCTFWRHIMAAKSGHHKTRKKVALRRGRCIEPKR
jgi:hypothetical protein